LLQSQTNLNFYYDFVTGDTAMSWFLSTAAVSTVAALASNPPAKIQIVQQNNPHLCRSMMHTGADLVKKYGWKKLFDGSTPRIARAFITTLVLGAGAPFLSDLWIRLLEQQNEHTDAFLPEYSEKSIGAKIDAGKSSTGDATTNPTNGSLADLIMPPNSLFRGQTTACHDEAPEKTTKE
jgi:hypothetical protein